MRIVFFGINDWEEDAIKHSFPGDDVLLEREKLNLETAAVARDAEVICIFIDSKIDASILQKLPNVKLIATRSTGFDHIDLQACDARGITVTYVPGYGDNTVAEYAFGLLLNLTRKIYHAIDQIKEAESFSLEGLDGIDLKGKVLGVIGTGRIGKEAVKIAKGFGMSILATDPYPDLAFAESFGISYVSLEELMGIADAITIHCPLTPQTEHLINRQNIHLLKKGVYLVNTARGSIVETAALIEGLNNGIFAGIGLDVLEEEGDTKDEFAYIMNPGAKEENLKMILENHVLMRHPRVLITPHNAFNTKEALERILSTTIENIKSFMAGNPKNIISREN